MRTVLSGTALLLAACSGEGGAPLERPDAANAGAVAGEAALPDGIRPAPGVYPFQGAWDGGPADCGRSDYGAVEAPLLITPDQVVGAENTCDVESVQELGSARYYVTMSCLGEGVRTPRDVTYEVADEGRTLIADLGGQEVRYARCEPSSEDE